MNVRLVACSIAVALGAAACSPPPPLPGGPAPEFEPPRGFELPKAGGSSDAAPPSSSAAPSASPPDASGDAAASGAPSTWTSTSVESPAPVPGAGDPIPADGRVGAKHLVVMYKGSRRAPESVTRSKADAQKLASACLARTKAAGAKFEAVVSECTDEPFGKERGGDLATFKPEVMDPAFSKALLDLKVGQTSGVVETPFGFHLILRTR